jgi:flagella basal body P-ring formation protein FlgA
MTLTARARALEDGGEGDVVRVTNLESRKIIDAVVTGSGEVRVDAPVAAVIR